MLKYKVEKCRKKAKNVFCRKCKQGVEIMTFGDKLRELLGERNIKQKELAQLLHISPSTLNSYITDSRMPDHKMIKAIAETLDVTTDYLLDYRHADKPVTENELVLLKKIRALNADDRETIAFLVDRLYKSKVI